MLSQLRGHKRSPVDQSSSQAARLGQATATDKPTAAAVPIGVQLDAAAVEVFKNMKFI